MFHIFLRLVDIQLELKLSKWAWPVRRPNRTLELSGVGLKPIKERGFLAQPHLARQPRRPNPQASEASPWVVYLKNIYYIYFN